MMARQILRVPAVLPVGDLPTDHITLQMNAEKKDLMMKLRQQSGLSWAEWYEHGLNLLCSETHDEMVSLLRTVPQAERSDPRTSLRVYQRDIERSQRLAESTGVPLRNVALMAMGMRMLWLPTTPCELTGYADED